MRIISGIYRSRKLKPPSSEKIRPTSDRAKETLFNLLSNEIEFPGIECMDLFCGSGALGLECVSRGSAKCYFVDRDTSLVRVNIDSLNISDKCEVIENDVIRFLGGFGSDEMKKVKLVLCDPPYDYKKYDELIERVARINSILVLEHSEEFDSGKKFNSYLYNQKKVGTVNFSFFNFSSYK